MKFSKLNIVKSAFLHSVEKALNFLIAQDEQTEDRLKALEGKVIALELTEPSFSLYWLFELGQIRLFSTWHHEDEIDASISGPFSAFARLGLTQAKVAKDLVISGDLRAVEAFKDVLSKLDIDWEDFLAQYTGDIAAYQIHKTTRLGFSLLKNTAKSLFENTKEYLQEDGQLLVSKKRFADFSADVREVNRTVERFEVKLKRLKGSAL